MSAFTHLKLTFIVVIALLLSLNTSNACADAEQDYQRSISDVAKQIKQVSRNLNSQKAALKTERDKLFETEQQLSELAKKVMQTQSKLDTTTERLDELKTELATVQESQTKNRTALETLIVSRYKQGEQNYLKLLLNQQNPYAVGRLNNYHRYFSDALQAKFSELAEHAEKIATLQTEQQVALETLAKEQQRQNEQQASLSKTQKFRASSVKKLNATVVADNKKLQALQKDRARLDNLLKQIAKQKAELERLEKARRAQEIAERAARPPAVVKDNTAVVRKPPPQRLPVKGGFTKQKGRLQYPVDSKSKRSFGSRLVESGMTSDGVFFETSISTPVRSIFRGRVLFADFLKGYGLLLIIDHGDDHISLYGHNDVLYKKVGDAVDTNEVVAKTGVTGGLKSPGLYFEIRKSATPVNPSNWCQ